MRNISGLDDHGERSEVVELFLLVVLYATSFELS
jgi:hypothetical protein